MDQELDHVLAANAEKTIRRQISATTLACIAHFPVNFQVDTTTNMDISSDVDSNTNGKPDAMPMQMLYVTELLNMNVCMAISMSRHDKRSIQR